MHVYHGIRSTFAREITQSKTEYMIEIGKIQELEIGRRVDFGCYLTDGNDEVLIPAKYVPENIDVGDKLNVFVYTDHQSRPIAVTIMPIGQLGDIVGLEVKAVTDFGAFLDNGLEKDLFVPNKEQAAPMKAGGVYAVKLVMDHKTNRMIGSSKVTAFLRKEVEELEEGDEVRLVVWQKTDLGYKVIINSQYQGLIYNNEIFERVGLGDNRKGFIKKVREDGKVDVSLQKQGYQAVSDMSNVVLRKLHEFGGVLEMGDKSSPDEIKEVFGMSKKNFKKILGGLYKAGEIEIYDYQIKRKS